MPELPAITPKTVVIGLGNPILADDGVGFLVVEEVSRKIVHPQIDFQLCSLAGFELLDVVEGYQKLIIVDSIKTGKHPVGEVMELDVSSLFTTVRLASVHDINLATALELGETLGIEVPKDIEIYVVEVEDNASFRESCCPQVAAAIPVLSQAVLDSLKKIYGDKF